MSSQQQETNHLITEAANAQSRELSDRQLIRGGARLELDQDQIAEIAREHEMELAVGKTTLRLASSETEDDGMIMPEDVDAWAEAVDNSAELSLKTSEITEPYYVLLALLVPPVSKNKKNIFGKVKDVWEPATKTIDKTIDHRLLTYKTSSYYTPSLEHNTLRSSVIELGPRKLGRYESEDSLGHLSVNSSEERIAGLSAIAHSTGIRQMLTYLGDMPEQVTNLFSSYSRRSYSFDLTPGSTSLTVGELRYQYNPEADSFILATNDEISEDIPRKLTVSQFLDALQATLEFIPTEKVEL